ncbi:DUF1262 family protein (DUF1262) [Rhynchospora pubera]|uniref:DUF1262 family protein (DUF1262) n=1 Tax=Rhynchospora pubera TaxID=906938 RepID=A0AAV8CUH5_9POAL|nr:DUF1262 family protein (DUF1262) [Rhynchospora pubera]
MYTTKRLAEFKATQEAALQLPPEGPNSGYAVINDDAHGVISSCCWGLFRYPIEPRVFDLPFHQNKILKVSHTDGDGGTTQRVLFVPVMNLPLSANRYYVVIAEGQHKGLVNTCSREEDVTTWCCLRYIKDVKPKPFDHRDIYQQIEIIPHNGQFTAKSVASDGFPPFIFRQQYWTLYEDNSKNYQLDEACGLKNAVRSEILNLDLTINFIAGMCCGIAHSSL